MNDTTLNAIAALAAPLDEARPCGDNLEYDPRFLALEDAVRGKPEVQYGSTITPAAAPDWKAIRAQALDLMACTRDLRVVVLLVRALLGLDGVPGLAAGLSLVSALLSDHWDGLHPQLDPDDDCDPTLRINTLAMLVQAGGLLRELLAAPLVEARGVGSFALQDIEAAARHSGDGQDSGEVGSAVAPAAIEAAFAAAGSEALAATAAALESAAGSVQAIDAALGMRLPAGTGLDMAPLAVLLRRALRAIGPYRDRFVAQPAIAPVQEDPAAAHSGMPRDGAIASRADVVQLLERMCGWYARHEPASPVPLLLQRAMGLVDKNFTELLQELAPEGLSQLAQVSGMRAPS
ncbi:type VI secretion system protein TssA [Pseudoduganella umbonata]|uniref:Type VI secretion system protein ImpA n=1 Tax=Pseudoduganella umbonata TaxID=864828 RepID=A0A4P8HKX0_9BURK|nr:type VI secretion system protein TssA [Pseudoduganella umbonata]MBB3221237.1 type VI secretion system protein ImpA [Pseudoduganella umbonata]QCP10419.1 type VI secretion system protein TssA [Pseudoduganella umbonata]